MNKISIIIPAYNVSKTLERAVDSIASQTYRNIEIVICDDMSTDNTYEIMEKLAAKDDRIIILKNEKNMKAAFTRNQAILNSTGEFIAIQDADDYSGSNRLEKQLHFLLENDEYDFVGANSSSFDENGFWKVTKLKNAPVFDDFIKGFPFVHGSILFRRETLEKVSNYRVSNETTRGQDADLILRIYKAGGKGYNIDDVFYFYQEDINTVKRRSFINRYKANKLKKKYINYSELSWKQKSYFYKTLIVGIVPPKLWYRIMRFLK